eukprot:1056263-Pyramimonas_sp.AAC.1
MKGNMPTSYDRGPAFVQAFSSLARSVWHVSRNSSRTVIGAQSEIGNDISHMTLSQKGVQMCLV